MTDAADPLTIFRYTPNCEQRFPGEVICIDSCSKVPVTAATIQEIPGCPSTPTDTLIVANGVTTTIMASTSYILTTLLGGRESIIEVATTVTSIPTTVADADNGRVPPPVTSSTAPAASQTGLESPQGTGSTGVVSGLPVSSGVSSAISGASSGGGGGGGGTSPGPIIGGVVGGILALALIALAAFFLWRRRRSRATKDSHDFGALEKNHRTSSPSVYPVPASSSPTYGSSAPPPVTSAPAITPVESHHLMGGYEPSQGDIVPVVGAKPYTAARETEVDEDGVSLRSPSPVQEGSGGRSEGGRDSVPRLPIYHRNEGATDRGPAL